MVERDVQMKILINIYWNYYFNLRKEECCFVYKVHFKINSRLQSSYSHDLIVIYCKKNLKGFVFYPPSQHYVRCVTHYT
jgi:hypothetical protein